MSNLITIANIVMEMRGLVKPGETLNHTYELLNGLADRIEAAHKREVGNGAKMHEALVNISKYADCAAMRQHDATTQHYIDQIREWAEAALSEPRRNCDVGTADEQAERFVDFAHLCFQSEVVRCAMNWAQMPYEEVGAK